MPTSSQIVGKYVNVQAIATDPNTDPHTFAANPQVAKEIALVMLLGLGGAILEPDHRVFSGGLCAAVRRGARCQQ
jgi:ABC-type Zn uptake system ZnuABC Zn-binding protein ZnuA